VMKKIVIFLVVFLVSFSIGFSQEQQQQVVREGNDIVVYTFLETERYQEVPKEIPTDTALMIIRGDQREYVLKGEKKERYFSSFPIIKENYSEDKVFLYQGKWESEIKPINQKTLDWGLTILFHLFPLVGILLISLFSQLEKVDYRKLLIFYGAILGSMLIGMSVGLSLGKLFDTIDVVHGFAVGGIIGGVATIIATQRTTNKFINMFIGAFAGGITGGVIGVFAICDFHSAFAYLIYIICVCVVSFLISFLVMKSIEQIWAKKRCLNPKLAK